MNLSSDAQALLAAGSTLFCLPIVLMSQLDIDSPWGVVSGRVLRSLAKCPFSWLLFYLEIALLAAACGTATLYLAGQQPNNAVWLVPMYFSALLLFARLLGRLALALGREAMRRPRNESQEIPHRVLKHAQAVAHFPRRAARPARMLRRIDEPLRMRHQAEHAARRVADAGHIAHRPIRIGRVGDGRDFGFRISDFGLSPSNPQSAIRNPQSPRYLQHQLSRRLQPPESSPHPAAQTSPRHAPPAIPSPECH